MMKFIIASLLFTYYLFGAATFDNQVSANDLAKALQGRGITISNPQMSRGQFTGLFSQFATFTNGINGANLQIDRGVLLTSSSALEAFTTNNSGMTSINPGDIGGATDTDLLSTITITNFLQYLINIGSRPLRNQAVFECDVTLDDNTRLLLVNYQFASDEYPEWVGSTYNDAFGFFISGGDLTQTYNIARAVTDATLVTVENIDQYSAVNINNINNGTVGNQSDGAVVNLNNSSLYIDNGGTDVGNGGVDTTKANIISEFDGFTTRLHATLDNLTPGQTYHFKMAVGDTADEKWDAGVFIDKIQGVRTPSMCYDYSVSLDGVTQLSTDRTIHLNTQENQKLAINIAIKSKEGDIDYPLSKLKVSLSPIANSSNVTFDNALYSENTINTLIPAHLTEASTPLHPEIGIGQQVVGDPTQGGTIKAYQRYFTKFIYTTKSGQFNAEINLDLNTSIDLGFGPISRITSTSDGSLVRCDQNLTYNPQWGMFNVERIDSGDYNPVTNPKRRFPLYTQVSGRDFDASVLVYDANATPPYSQELQVTKDYYVDLELIDVSKYNDENSFFSCQDTDPDIIQSLANNQKSIFVKIPAGSSRVDIVHNDDILTHNALKEAAFRIWSIVDLNSTLIQHTCDAPTRGACFRDIYINQIRQDTSTGKFCDAACTTSNDINKNCYDCLRLYYAQATCSRDNFSIRPVSYSINVLDTNESNSTSDPSVFLLTNDAPSNDVTLAAGYKYKFEANATQYLSKTYAPGYYGLFDNSQSGISSFKFQNSTGTNCADTSDYRFNIRFNNGQIDATIDDNGQVTFGTGELYTHSNVGDYHYHLEDNNWTIVDQKRYAHKTFADVDDCVAGENTISINGDTQSGCIISSDYTEKDYYDLALRYEPYSFDVDDINMTLPNDLNFVYTNNIDTTDEDILHMAVLFEGNITALIKGNSIASNFTKDCAASPVIFDINRTLNYEDNNVSEGNITATDESLTIGGTINIAFEKNYIDINGTKNYDENNESNGTLAFSISKTQFENNGSAPIKAYYNFTKTDGFDMNPINVRFNTKDVISETLKLSVGMKNDFTPKGSAPQDSNVTFYYARIITDQDPYNFPANLNTQNIIVNLDVFCSLIPCNNYGDIFNSPARIDSKWYSNAEHNASIGDVGDGSILRIQKKVEDNFIPLFNFKLVEDDCKEGCPLNRDNDGNNTVIGLDVVHRPSVEYICITPHQWIEPICVDANAILGGGWTGAGNRGNVVNTNASTQTNRKRVDW